MTREDWLRQMIVGPDGPGPFEWSEDWPVFTDWLRDQSLESQAQCIEWLVKNRRGAYGGFAQWWFSDKYFILDDVEKTVNIIPCKMLVKLDQDPGCSGSSRDYFTVGEYVTALMDVWEEGVEDYDFALDSPSR